MCILFNLKVSVYPAGFTCWIHGAGNACFQMAYLSKCCALAMMDCASCLLCTKLCYPQESYTYRKFKNHEAEDNRQWKLNEFNLMLYTPSDFPNRLLEFWDSALYSLCIPRTPRLQRIFHSRIDFTFKCNTVEILHILNRI